MKTIEEFCAELAPELASWQAQARWLRREIERQKQAAEREQREAAERVRTERWAKAFG